MILYFAMTKIRLNCQIFVDNVVDGTMSACSPQVKQQIFFGRPPSSPHVAEGKTAESSPCGRRLAVTGGRSSPLFLPSSPLLLKRCRSAARDVQRNRNDGETNDWNVQEKAAAAEPLNANNTARVCACECARVWRTLQTGACRRRDLFDRIIIAALI